MSKVKYSLAGVVVSAITALAIYLYFSLNEIAFDVAKFFKYFGIVIGGIAALFGSIFGAWKLIQFLTKKDSLGMGKNVVDIVDAQRIWIEEFVKANNIPYIKQPWNKNQIKLVDEDAVKIRNQRAFTDPNGQTAQLFLRFEAHVSQGDRQGIHTVIISLDKGEKWIRKNWPMSIEDNESTETAKYQFQKFPLTSAKEQAIRLQSKLMENVEEGDLSISDVKELMNASSQQPQKQQQSQPPIQSPSVQEHKIIAEQPKQQQKQGNIQDDIENYRRSNR